MKELIKREMEELLKKEKELAKIPQSEEQQEWHKQNKAKLLEKVKKYDTIGALWIDDETKEQERIDIVSLLHYSEYLFEEDDRHTGNKYYFQLELMIKMSYQNSDIEELIKKVAELEKRLPNP